MSRTRFFLPLLTGVAIALAAASTDAATLANFTGGNGTASPDQFVGTAGNGWVGPWGGSTSTGTVVTTTPLNGAGDPYLSLTGTGSRTVVRQFGGFGSDPAQPHLITWQWRFDGNFAQFSANNDRVQFFADDSAQTGTSAGNSWLIGVTQGVTGFPNGNFYFFDGTSGSTFVGSNVVDSGLTLQDDTVYDFEVLVDPLAGTYDALITDGVNVASANGLGFRNGTPGVYDFVHFGINASSSSDNLQFSLDSVAIHSPEPASIALWTVLGLLGVGYGWRRTKRRA